ncbi:U3 small nucleolar RNA-associated protein 15 homolog [Nilaparvata lugens]|uniref:U3 small nucleolar RNA-associated protein 15 homolog n=1 Tax=Nilaparvata lugens TaxID=108931 RepID=UPI00193E9711|nr:U3 small nucleolar RNA-associated protein 15 homolog [Nilaparvata lugens]
MTAFKKTNTQLFTKPRALSTEDNDYWNQFGVPALLKEFGAIDYVDFSPLEPHPFAVTCSVRVQLYNPITRSVVKNLNKFKETAYGGSFRSDGLLLVAGGEEGVLRLFDVSSKALMRVFKGHTAPTHRAFFTSDKTHLVSFSDDKTVSTWDIPCETRLNTFTGHTDYIRAGAVSSVSPSVILSGSYDGTVRMYDYRTKDDAIFTANHGAPVESLLFLPSGGIFLSAGGNEVRVWDAFAGGRLLSKMCHHHKTVTSLCLASNGTRILSGSLDRHVKVYNVSTYQPVHTFDYPNSILSVGISPNDETLVVGMVDGLISVRRRGTEVAVSEKVTKKKTNYRFAGDNYRLNNHVDVVVPSEKMTEKTHDRYFRTFKYSSALAYGLNSSKVKPPVTVSIFQELIRRKGFHQAIAGSDSATINRFIKFVWKHLGDYRFTRTLIDVTNIFLDVYDDDIGSFDENNKKHIEELRRRVKKETEFTYKLATLQGSLHMLLSAASIRNHLAQQNTAVATSSLEPTQAALETIVFNVT